MNDTDERRDLSITIVSYNTRNLTRECLQSIYDNTREVSFEVWVIDNNSADGSADMIETEFPQVHLIRNTENVGLAAATNQGLMPSTGRYILALNSDTIVQPDALEILVRFMDAHPDAGGATAKLILPDGGEHPPVCGNIPTLWSELLDALSPFGSGIAAAAFKARFGPPIDYTRTQEVPCVLWGTAFIVTRKVLDTVGGQDPIFFVYGEDTDWAMRIRKAGWKLYYVAEAIIIHYGGRSTGQTNSKSIAQLCKSRCRRTQKHYGFLAGWTLRLEFATVCAIRLAKWLVLYPLLKRSHSKASERVDEMWRIIWAVLRY